MVTTYIVPEGGIESAVHKMNAAGIRPVSTQLDPGH